MPFSAMILFLLLLLLLLLLLQAVAAIALVIYASYMPAQFLHISYTKIAAFFLVFFCCFYCCCHMLHMHECICLTHTTLRENVKCWQWCWLAVGVTHSRCGMPQDAYANENACNIIVRPSVFPTSTAGQNVLREKRRHFLRIFLWQVQQVCMQPLLRPLRALAISKCVANNSIMQRRKILMLIKIPLCSKLLQQQAATLGKNACNNTACYHAEKLRFAFNAKRNTSKKHNNNNNQLRRWQKPPDIVSQR